MREWIKMSAADRKLVLEDAGLRNSLPAAVLEKDAWVTLLLEALYSLPGISEYLLIKGGTSLSKAYGLIKRFSEDIDFALDRRLLGESFSGTLSKTKIEEKLRPASALFVREQLLPRLHHQLLEMGVPAGEFNIIPKADAEPNADPLPLYVNYVPLMSGGDYILPRVEIEVGFRSLMEPAEERTVSSLLSDIYPTASYMGKPVVLQTVRPDRTFLEKVFLLHEQFTQPGERALPRNRMSRHLYDVEQLMDTEYAKQGMADKELYNHIVEHRKLFTPVGKDARYEQHGPATIIVVPPPAFVSDWEADYRALTESMVTGTVFHPFPTLLQRLRELQARFRAVAITGG